MINIIIGDVHGCIDELKELLKTIGYHPSHRLIFVGDIIDRGPDSAGCVKYIRELKAESVLGNHEHQHIQYRKYLCNEAPPLKFKQAKIDTHHTLSKEDIYWFNSLPLQLTMENFTIVHAGLEPKYSLNNQSENVMYVRSVNENGEMIDIHDKYKSLHFWTDLHKGNPVVFGHSVMSLDKPFIYNDCYAIDQGCVFGGKLTAMIISNGNIEFASVKSKQRYISK
jgi:diadenosine tetraphosphatase ApaH/serine/threonine PP2A family protein phosphatase